MGIKWIALAMLFSLLFYGCFGVYTSGEETEPNITDTSLPVTETEEPAVVVQEPATEPTVPTVEPVEESDYVTNYADDQGRIRFAYRSTWRIVREVDSSNSLTVELVDPDGHSSNKIQIRYAPSFASSVDQQMQELVSQGTEVETIVVGDTTFLLYETEFEPLPGKRMRQRIATTTHNDYEYTVSLIAREQDFEGLLPIYGEVLNSVEVE